MSYTLACRDTGVDCDFVSRGETEAEVMEVGTKHVKAVHNYTDEQLSDPKFKEDTMKMIKKE